MENFPHHEKNGLSKLMKNRIQETPHLIMERAWNKFKFSLNLFCMFPAITKSQKYIKFKLTSNQDLCQARSSINDSESPIS